MSRTGWIAYSNSAWQENMMAQVGEFADGFSRKGIACRTLSNEQLAMTVQNGLDDLPYPRPDFVLFWSKDVVLARTIELAGIPVFNSAAAIAACDNKLQTHLALQENHVRCPLTLPLPMIYPRYTPAPEDTAHLLDTAERLLGFPMVVKEAYGSFGLQVSLARNRAELQDQVEKVRYAPAMLQRFVASSAGTDYRIQVVGDEVVAVMRRVNREDFRSNVASGGHVEVCTLPEGFAELAVRASRALGLDFSGVDMLTDEDGGPIVCEVNSNAFIRNISRISGTDVAGRILEHVLVRIS